MPGTITLKPIQADLSKDKNILGTLDPYCQITLGKQKAKTHVCKKGGSFPNWNDAITLDREYESFCYLEIKDKETIIPDATIGTVKIDLEEITTSPEMSKWYDVYKKDELIGQILIESTFKSQSGSLSGQGTSLEEKELPLEKE